MTNATRDLLEQHFDTAFAAPNGIAKLRELILTLAMQGKLVPQDPNDASASELLKGIEAEKKRLVNEGKIKAPKPLPPIKPEEVPYELPQGWKWVRLPECYFGIGNKSNQIQTKEYLERGQFPVIDQGKNFVTGYCDDKSKLLHLERPVIVFGDHTKNIKFVDFDFVIGADGVKVLCPYTGISTNFLYRLIQSFDLTDRGYARHFKVLNEKLVPLPPLPEQHRIVAKIDQLMARCDALEALRKEQEEKRLAVHAAAMQPLLAAPDSSAWGFIEQHFGELYSVKENVAELRKVILQLAVMGKLVSQDQNDQPASKLLNEIAADKKQLAQEGKIKKLKPPSLIRNDSIPFQLPQNWQWITIEDIAEAVEYGTSQKTGDDSSLVPVYRMGNIVDGKLVDSGFKYLPPDIEDLPKLYLKYDDILFNRTNSYELVGKSALYTGPNNHATFASYLIRVRLHRSLSAKYFSLAMNAPYFRSTQIEAEIVQQCGQANFNGTKLSQCLVPLPPINAQHRIVAKVDHLTSLCDTLDQQIAAATCKQTELLNAVMAAI